MTYIGQGNLHVFLEIFLALDLTAILALLAEGWISHPGPFHKTQRHAQEFETLSCFSVPLSLPSFSPSKLALVALWVSSGHKAAFSPFSVATGTKMQVEDHACRYNRKEREAERQSASETDLCFFFNFSPCSFPYSCPN